MTNGVGTGWKVRRWLGAGRRALLMLGTLALATGVTTAVAPGVAHAAYPTSSYYVSYGNTVLQGTITWYNLSTTARVTLHAASPHRGVCLFVQNASTWKDNCGIAPVTGDYSFSLTTDGSGPGGWTYAEMQLYDATNSDYALWGFLAGDYCYRTDSYCHTI
jgi:hypothetical protein